MNMMDSSNWFFGMMSRMICLFRRFFRMSLRMCEMFGFQRFCNCIRRLGC